MECPNCKSTDVLVGGGGWDKSLHLICHDCHRTFFGEQTIHWKLAEDSE